MLGFSFLQIRETKATKAERKEYDVDVYVVFDPKAWASKGPMDKIWELLIQDITDERHVFLHLDNNSVQATNLF